MLTTDQKGNVAEACIAAAAVKFGVEVYRPMGEGQRYDLIFDMGSRLLRVQCKWTTRYNDILIVRCYSTRRIAGDKIITRRYTEDEIDAVAAYCDELDRCYLLPVELWSGRRQLHLRLAPSRNNQLRRINWAKDYEFAARLEGLGAVAQLGERQSGRLEATGSSPVGSTGLGRASIRARRRARTR
jgi:PD-(D/E)XK nuclease superfamily protein